MRLSASEYECDRTWINVVIVGRTRVGKGGFVNSIRGINSNTVNSANATHGIIPGPLPIEKYGYPDNENPIIYFYDTGGFGDAFNENYNLEEVLMKYQKENKIKFDAIAFIAASNTFVKEEIQPLEDQENKVCLVLYITNKVDVLKSETEIEEKFQEEKKN
jgi:GTPase Era involved in 16S rRNA processing